MRLASLSILLLNVVNMAKAAPSHWVHPGVYLDAPALAFITGQVAAGKVVHALGGSNTTSYNAYQAMLNSSWASLDRLATPYVSVQCGSNSTPNVGCTAERQDALAAYTMSLLWTITLDHKYADKAISIMNAWSPVLQNHTDSNAPLQTGWSGVSWSRAAEIIRHTYWGWQAADIAQFETMLRNVYLPIIINGSNSNGNWELVMMEAAIGMAVFLEDAATYDAAMTKFLGRVPAYIYLTSDGPYPLKAPDGNQDTEAKIIKYWQYQTTFVDGITQETCRDFAHTGYGISSISAVAETSRIQGTDLWTTDLGTRVEKALELHTQYEGGVPVPSWFCNGTFGRGLGPITEPPYNALAHRMGHNLPYTKNFTISNRPQGTNYLFQAWETLTNADNPFPAVGW